MEKVANYAFQKFRFHPLLDREDLISVGFIGLQDAATRYDPDNKTKAQFKTYARPRIYGKILDHIRELDWVPRLERKRQKEDPSCIIPKIQSAGVYNTEDTIPDNISILDLNTTHHDTKPGARAESLTGIRMHDKWQSEARMDDLQDFLFQDLSPRSKEIARDYYVNGLTQQQIADKIGVNYTRVSQLFSERISYVVKDRAKQYSALDMAS